MRVQSFHVQKSFINPFISHFDEFHNFSGVISSLQKTTIFLCKYEVEVSEACHKLSPAKCK